MDMGKAFFVHGLDVSFKNVVFLYNHNVRRSEHIRMFCEAQGKGRARGRPRKVTQRSFIDCRLSIIVYFP